MYEKKNNIWTFKISNYLNNWINDNNIKIKEISKLFPSKTGGLTGCISNWRQGLNLITEKQYLKIQNWAEKNNIKGLDRKWESFISIFKQEKDFSNVWESNMTQSQEKSYGHPTQKPLYILKQIIRTSSNKNDIVLDFFLGSGSTMVASLSEERRFIGCENNEEYINICNKRIKEIQNSLFFDF